MFQFRRFPTYGYLIHHTLTVSSTAGFPHSEIHGSQAAFASPWLIVDRYVLRRLLVPRHSPYALSSLTMFFSRDSSVLQLRFRRRSSGSSRKVLILRSNHLVLFETVFTVSWVFPSTIIYCSCYPKIFYHFTFTCALFSFQGTCEPFGSLGNFEIIFVFLVRRAMLLHALERKAEMSQNLVGSSGLEPPTSRLSGVRSNLLSYEPIHVTEVLPLSIFSPFWWR